jgi:hypothetical protein
MNRPLLLALFLYCSIPLSPLEQTVLIPVEVYLGDSAIIRHRFAVKDAGLPMLEADKPLELPPKHPVFLALEPDYTVTGVSLAKTGPDWALTLRFTPWKTGKFDIPPFDLRDLLELTHEQASADTPVMVDIAPVTIASLTGQLGETTLRPPAPPVIFPGSTYALLGIAVALALVLAGLVILGVRFRKSGKTLRGLYRSMFYSAAGRRAVKALRKLAGNSSGLSPREYAGALEAILRIYLDAHFRWPFTAASVPELFPAFAEITGDMMDAGHFAQVEKLDALFRRCDFLRYAGMGSAAGIADNAVAGGGSQELAGLAAEAQGLVVFFERGE